MHHWKLTLLVPQLKLCYKSQTQLPSFFNPSYNSTVPSFGPDLSLKQCYLGKVDITILIWKLRNIVYLHTKLVVKLLLMAEGSVRILGLPGPRKFLTFSMSVITLDSVKTVLAQCPERNAFLQWCGTVFSSIKFVNYQATHSSFNLTFVKCEHFYHINIQHGCNGSCSKTHNI